MTECMELPKLGLGTYKLTSPDVIRVVLEAAVTTGYRLIDTAAVYHNEAILAEGLSLVLPAHDLSPQDIFITSKLAPKDHGYESTLSAVRQSLTQLQRDCLDLYLIHWPGTQGVRSEDPRNRVLRKESWTALETMHRQDKLQSIGVSNYEVGHLEELLEHATVRPAVLQVEFHPHLNQRGLLQFCKDHNIQFQAYSSLGTGKFQVYVSCVASLKVEDKVTSQTNHSNAAFNDTTGMLLGDETIVKMAAKYSKTPAQLLLWWGIQHGVAVIPKASNPDHIKTNAQIFDFDISDVDMQSLNSLDQGRRYCWDPSRVT